MKVSDKQVESHYGKHGTVLMKPKEISHHLLIEALRGGMLDELKKENRFEEHVTQMEDELLENVIESRIRWPSMAHRMDSRKRWISYPLLSRELVQWLFIEGFTLTECAGKSALLCQGIKRGGSGYS